MILVPIVCMIVISLYGVGFFDPTITDFKMLFSRIIHDASIGESIAAETEKEEKND